jgi:cytidine deaminase
MDEDLLSPQMGRLIDQAKAVVRLAGEGPSPAEGVALLTADGSVYAECSGERQGPPQASAAGRAIAAARRAGHAEIVAAAVAVPDDPGQSAPPSKASRQSLAEIDLELPIVFKDRGRWVMLALSALTPSE